MYYSERDLLNKRKLLPIPAGWRRLRLGEAIPHKNKWQNNDEWLDGASNLGYLKRINRGFVRYIVPIENKPKNS